MKHIRKIFENEDDIELPGIRRTPTGKERVESWVNIKIDKDMRIRVSRYTRALDKFCNPSDIYAKFDILSNPKISKYGVQGKLSIIILLQYLKEIKNNFDGSASGFLFEEYISGLLHLKRVSGNKNDDIRKDENDSFITYQVKFYDGPSSQIEINPKPCDFYIVGLKFPDHVKIWVLEHNVHRLKKNGMYIYVNTENNKTFIDMTSVKKIENPYILKFNNIDKNIKKISDDLREYIDEIYKNISELSYNIETILTGVNEDQEVLSKKDEIKKYYDKSEDCIDKLSKNLKKMKDEILRKVGRYLN